MCAIMSRFHCVVCVCFLTAQIKLADVDNIIAVRMQQHRSALLMNHNICTNMETAGKRSASSMYTRDHVLDLYVFHPF